MIAVVMRCVSTSTSMKPVITHGSASLTIMMAASLEPLTVVLISLAAAPAALELIVAS